jgi:hypothetical protein
LPALAQLSDMVIRIVTLAKQRSLSGARIDRALRGELVRSAKDENRTPKDGAESNRTGRDLGDALRRAYDEAVGEAVPNDLLDLLKKLD